MKDIVDRLEKRIKYLWRFIFITYVLLVGFKLEGEYKEYISWAIFMGALIVDKLIGYLIRTMYKIELSDVLEIVQLMGIKGIEKGFNTYSYSEDYIRSNWFLNDESSDYKMFRRERHRFYSASEYHFNYLTIYNKNKNNNDKIEIYKTLKRYRQTTQDLKNIEMSIRLELSYINDKFVLKNNYSAETLNSLNTGEAFATFYKFIDDIKVLFDHNDFYTFIRESSFDLELSTGMQRNLIKSTLPDGSKFYRLHAKWADNIDSLKLGRFRKHFRDGEVITFCDYSAFFEDRKKRNLIIPEWLDEEKYSYSNMFDHMLNEYQKGSDETSMKYSNPDDVEKWKRLVVKKRLKMKLRISNLKKKVNTITYKKVQPEDIEFWSSRVLKNQLSVNKRTARLKNKIKKRTYKVNMAFFERNKGIAN